MNRSPVETPEPAQSTLALATLATIESLPPMLTPRDVAALLKIGVSTLAALRKCGKFGPSPKRIGSSVRFVTVEVVAWIHAGCPNTVEWRNRGEATR
jgi:predicted DNA-binding transcriptional regulator AlpA